MDWVIRPASGVGALDFGMSASEVASALVEPIGHGPRGFWSRYETRALLEPTLAYDQAGLAEIEFASRIPSLMLDGLNVFFDDPLIVLQRV